MSREARAAVRVLRHSLECRIWPAQFPEWYGLRPDYALRVLLSYWIRDKHDKHEEDCKVLIEWLKQIPNEWPIVAHKLLRSRGELRAAVAHFVITSEEFPYMSWVERMLSRKPPASAMPDRTYKAFLVQPQVAALMLQASSDRVLNWSYAQG